MAMFPTRTRNRRLAGKLESFSGAKQKKRPVLAEGDSWFDFPIHKDILDHLGKTFAVFPLAHHGDELETMFKAAQFYQHLYKEDWVCLLFSGGGDDVLHTGLPALLRDRDTVSRREDIVIAENLAFEMSRLGSLYQRIHDAVQIIRPGLPLVVHGYDYAVPWNKGTKVLTKTFGPWMYPVMEQKHIRDAGEQADAVRVIVHAFNDMLKDLASRNALFHYARCLDSVKGRWNDEIHPKSAGFRDVAAKIAEVIEGLPTA